MPDDYFQREALSKSGLVRLAQSPAHFKAPPKPRTPQQQTALDIGQATHTAILEPDMYNLRFMILPPEMTLQTKAGKQLKKEAEEAGKILLKDKDHQNVQSMALAVRHHPGAKLLVEAPGPVEEPVYWKDPVYGFDCKAKPDKRTPNCIVPDLKSTGDARYSKFQKVIYDKCYHWQAFWYLWGCTIATDVPHRDFLFIVIERENPWDVMIYFASPKMFFQAAREIAPLRKIYAKCLEKDQWPGYPTAPQYIDLPPWARKKEVEMIEETQFLLEGGK